MPTILHFQPTYSVQNRSIAQGVARFAACTGWRFHVVPYANAAEKEDDLFGDSHHERGLERILSLWQPDGCIVVYSSMWPDLADRIGALPCVPLDNPGATSMVSLDNAAIGRAAAEEMLRLDIASTAFVSLQSRYYWRWCVERAEAFAEAVRERGLEPTDLGAVGNMANAATEQFMEGLRRLPRPCGVFAVNDSVARRVLDAAAVLGLNVPYDLVVVGADDDESLCEVGTVTLTSVRPDFEGYGFAAAAELARLMETPNSPPQRIRVGGASVTRRASSRRLLRRDALISAVLEDIRKRYAERITVASLAQERGVFLRTLERRFRRATGRPIGHEIADARFRAAQRMLAEPPRRGIDAIANLCGYESASTLR